MKVIVFDIGGTLMEYKNMPNVWIDFYNTAFDYVRNKLSLDISDDDIINSLEVLKSYNPRVNYREIDYSPEVIFEDVTKDWKFDFVLKDVINTFFSSMNLVSHIYDETITILKEIKKNGYYIATMTDVATAMPDEMHKSYFLDLLPYFDMYVSSCSCGYRKPNPKGLQDIAAHFEVNADDMIMIGDEEKDIITAKRFGCKSVLVDRKTKHLEFGQDFTILDLTELMNIL